MSQILDDMEKDDFQIYNKIIDIQCGGVMKDAVDLKIFIWLNILGRFYKLDASRNTYFCF